MTELIDNTEMFQQAHRLVAAADLVVEKLNRDVDKNDPQKVSTVEAVTSVLNAQSKAIRYLVEQHAQISDQLNVLIANHLNP